MTALMLECAVRTDAGPRPNNEDAVFADPRLAAVADGVGGAAAGEVVSRTYLLLCSDGLTDEPRAGWLEPYASGARR
jgi:PPM family protein phosphatase